MRIVYNSFHGRFSDNPRALFERLQDRAGLSHLWLADPAHAETFPVGVRTVPIDTQAATEALESADLLIANTHTEVEWTKPAGTTYVQTWHGTPLKRIHADVLWGPEWLVEHLSLDVERWDVLLSPNRYSTTTMRQAFRWSGEILETGYPRNDVLLSPHAGEVRARVRRELGIDDGRTAVLYTPTWRDDAFWEGSPQTEPLELDVDRFVADLGDDHVLLLRLHYKLTGRLRPRDHPAVRDVSHHPDVADLYLAADAMVTDYSSTMFDFAVTGKPLLFYAYDLDRYRDELRGFYFDLSADPPGPLVVTTPELVARVRDLDAVRAEHAAAYDRFRERFCHLDDGHATERFLDRFVPGAVAAPA